MRHDFSMVVVNAARIGDVGGLRTFLQAMIRCFEETSCAVNVVVPAGESIDSAITTPKWLASPSHVSSLRPILWWFYGAACFPAKSGTKILCSTHHVLPFRKHQIVTVHDIRPYYYPDSWAQHFNFRYLLPRALKRCDGVLTVSEATKESLLSVYGLERDRVHVVPNIVDTNFFQPCDSGNRGDDPYLLTVGSTWKHKNVAELLRMHEYWSRRYKLKIVAGKGQYLDSLKKLVVKLGIENQVEFLSGLSAVKLRSLYQNCASLVYPSVMEGFGLPPLEAMACGRPVIVSDIAVFRELYGDVPLYARLGDVESWKNAFASLETYSEDRIRSGMDRANAFSLERMRKALFGALEAIWGDGVLIS